eukprot:CAMPEP_0179375662 /NCGR_PEP_ID=MMETSP0797-20121207/87917_1 /TAXON_ID=47934 /ORGANISM="Dinophysis acuminata, Strain DAEP01" /LENGTH=445 /DNA_ID=CAMNT_0021091673 /DNA_START=55 /DNA_END=1389 /DNA_ORIENTATION=-
MSVRSMSPRSTSEWCSSLAQCKVQGQLLRALQGEIVRRSIDGKQFDQLLRNNTLMDLDIEDLNPRVCVSIRKAWNTDFAQVTFTPHHATGNGRLAAPSNGLPPRLNPTGNPAANSAQPGGQAPACSQQAHDHGRLPPPDTAHLQAPQPFEAHARRGPPSSDGAADSVSTLQRQLGQRQQHYGARGPQAGGVSLKGYEAPGSCPATSSNQYSGNQYRRAGPAQAPQDQQQVGLGDLLPPRPTAPSSYAAPSAHVYPGSSAPSSHDPAPGEDFDAVFAPRPKACTSYAQSPGPQHGGGAEQQGMRGRPAQGRRAANNDWDGVSLGDALAPRPQAQNRYAQPGTSEDGASQAGVPDAYEALGGAAAARRCQDPGWDGSSLGDVLGKKQQARNRYGGDSTSVTDSTSCGTAAPRQSSDSGWDGASLGDVLVARQRAKNGYEDRAGSEAG